MKHMKGAWQYVLVEPCAWLFYCFFQPPRFKRECESKGFLSRMVSMLRLALPMFLCSYPLALGVQIIGGLERNPRRLAAPHAACRMPSSPSGGDELGAGGVPPTAGSRQRGRWVFARKTSLDPPYGKDCSCPRCDWTGKPVRQRSGSSQSTAGTIVCVLRQSLI